MVMSKTLGSWRCLIMRWKLGLVRRFSITMCGMGPPGGDPLPRLMEMGFRNEEVRWLIWRMRFGCVAV